MDFTDIFRISGLWHQKEQLLFFLFAHTDHCLDPQFFLKDLSLHS